VFARSFKSMRALLLATTVLFAGACADDFTRPELPAARSEAEAASAPITVMSRNIYLGANLDAVLAIQNPNEVPFAIATAWAAVVASNFPERAEALADEIQTKNPHLIGLQEATIYRRQSPSDYVLGNRTTNASAVVYDFVDILLDALEARGLHYQVVARVVNNDLEFPMYTGTGPLPFDDIRYTDQDVILARADVAVTNPVARNFAAAVPLAIGGVQVQLRRGWVAVDADVGGHLIRFANSHLEVQTFRPVQEAQARELTSWLADSPLPVVLVGDFNSAANADAPAANRTDSYNILLGAGYFDIWTRGNGQEAGLTCCQAPNLRNPTSELTQRLDLILVNQKLNHFVGGAQMDVVGEETADRTPSGLWPSDHAGVVATLHLPRGRVW
jgi:hypothetical protein